MIWMALIGLGLIAGVMIFGDDDDQDENPVVSSDDPHFPNTQIEGTDENDLLFGTSSSDSILGLNGDDQLTGASGNDLAAGGQGNDSVFGNDGTDILLGGSGDDLLHGGDNNDLLIDGNGADDLHGDLGDDLIISSGFMNEQAALALFQNPDPNLTASTLTSALEFDFSEDTDSEGDTVDGGYGNDTIFGGIGDTLTGAAGADTFVTGDWVEGEEATVITDFEIGQDVLLYGYEETLPVPELTMVAQDNAGGGSDAIILANGIEVIRVLNMGETFDISEDIALIPNTG